MILNIITLLSVIAAGLMLCFCKGLAGASALFAALGALIFVLSDMGVCHGMLCRIPKKLNFLYLGIYYLAQLLLGLSAF